MIQLVAHFLPWLRVAAPQMLAHIFPELVHALLRRTVAQVRTPRPPAEMWPECITQKIESLPPGIPQTRLLLVERQVQARHYPTTALPARSAASPSTSGSYTGSRAAD